MKCNNRGKHMKSVNMNPVDIQLTKPFAMGRVLGLLAGSLWMAGAAQTALGEYLFTLDASQSRISISGNVMGAPIQAQGSGSLTTQYGGTLLAEISGNTIQFPGQSQVVALDNGSWQPLSDGGAGSDPANYGGKASRFSATGVAAVRDVEVDVTSGALALVNGSFDTQAITVSIPAGAPSSMAYRVQGSINDSGVVALGGESASGQSAQGSLITVGSQQVLTMPIYYRFFFSLASPNDTMVTLTGQLVATRSL
jgi:hypothetical protein